MLLDVLARAQRRPQVPRVRVGRVFRPAVQVLHDPVQPAAEVVLAPALDVVEEQLLSAFLRYKQSCKQS